MMKIFGYSVDASFPAWTNSSELIWAISACLKQNLPQSYSEQNQQNMRLLSTSTNRCESDAWHNEHIQDRAAWKEQRKTISKAAEMALKVDGIVGLNTWKRILNVWTQKGEAWRLPPPLFFDQFHGVLRFDLCKAYFNPLPPHGGRLQNCTKQKA